MPNREVVAMKLLLFALVATAAMAVAQTLQSAAAPVTTEKALVLEITVPAQQFGTPSQPAMA